MQEYLGEIRIGMKASWPKPSKIKIIMVRSGKLRGENTENDSSSCNDLKVSRQAFYTLYREFKSLLSIAAIKLPLHCSYRY